MKKDKYVKISIGLILIAYMMFLLFRPISEFLINKNDLFFIKSKHYYFNTNDINLPFKCNPGT